MCEITLQYPDESMEAEAIAFRQEFIGAGESEISGSYKWDTLRYSYGEWLQIIRDNLDEKKVSPRFGPSQTFFALNRERQVVGVINFRHVITDFYKYAGHVGFSVRPSRRRMGIADRMLREIVRIAGETGLSEICLVCRADNEASRKTILKNGGSLRQTFTVDEITREEDVIRL